MAIVTTRLTAFGRTEAVFNDTNKTVVTDANKQNGGLGENPNPVYLLASSLSACALTVICMVAKKLNVSAEGCWAEVTDVEEDMAENRVTKIAITFHLKASYDAATRKRLEAYAHRGCFVGNTLTAEKVFTFLYE